MRYLVTGASGFIGNRLVRELENTGHEVVVLGRVPISPNIPFYHADLGDGNLPPEAFREIDGLYHLAGIAHTSLEKKNEWLYQRVNVEATARLAELAVESGCRKIVFFSSVQALPGTSNEGIQSAYGQSKRRAEQILEGYGSRMQICVLRPSLVYGPHVKGNLESMMRAMRSGRFPPLPDFGGRRSMVYVQDVVRAACMAMEDRELEHAVYELTDGLAYSAREISDAIRKALGLELPRWHLPKPAFEVAAKAGDLANLLPGLKVPFDSNILRKLKADALYSSASIQKDLGWRPTCNFYDAAPEMAQAFLTAND